ncbi:MAG: flippase-like domain-containing protein [Granulosicoccus sp.]|nr:flippase-like domain-containing protein [Granulosicoccus sp.]
MRMVLGILLLLLVLWLIDARAALDLFDQTDWRWIAVCVVLIQLQVVLSAIRWQVTAIRLGQDLRIRRAVREYFLATLGNLSLPGGVTGDAARIYRNRQVAGMTVSAHSVVIERLAGQVALAVVTIIGWLSWPLLMQGSAPDIGRRLLLMAVTLLAVLLLAVIATRYTAHRVAVFVRNFGPAVQRAWLDDGQWLIQGVLSVAIVSTYLVVFAACAAALHQPLPVAAVVSIVPLVLLSMVIPVSIGGWGIREAVAASLWPLAGLSAESAVATSILYGLVSVLGTVPGALWAALIPQRG